MLASLRSRLVLSNLLIILAGLSAVVVVAFKLVEARSVEIRKAELRAQSAAVAAEIHQLYAARGGAQELPAQIYLASRLLHERIVVISPRGQDVIDSEQRTPFFHGLQFEIDQNALRRAQNVGTICGTLLCFQHSIMGTEGRNGGAVVLVAQAGDVSPAPGSLLQVFLIGAGTALLVWLFIGVYVTRSIFRPLLRITDATERIAGGDYSVRVPTRGQGEIGQLARSFNGMARQVQLSNQVLKDFLANVSHDLRTPLTMITGFSEALLDGTAKPDDIGSSAAVIHEESIKMQRLVDDLLQLTRLESGLFTLERHPIEIRPFAQNIIDRTLHAADPAKSDVVMNQISPDAPRIDVDPERLERALRNLLDNALRYTPPDGRVIVAARRVRPGWIEMSVSDTGSGIAAEDLSRVFERFYRSDRSRERGHGLGHSGLGLAIVKEVVEAHGGSVTVESEVGVGTVFRMLLPEALKDRAEQESPGATTVQRVATQ